MLVGAKLLVHKMATHIRKSHNKSVKTKNGSATTKKTIRIKETKVRRRK
jgi:hypothetical protein